MTSNRNPAYNISSSGINNYKDFLAKRYRLALAQPRTEEGAAHLRWMLETTEQTPLSHKTNISRAKSKEIMEIRALVLQKLRAQPGYGTESNLWDAREDRRVTDEAVAECKAKRDGEKAEEQKTEEQQTEK